MAKFIIENYGCQMNVSEANSLRDLLIKNGHTEVSHPDQTDTVILNTCSVRTTAENRVRGRICLYKGINQRKRKKIKVILMGCMAQNTGMRLKKDFPGLVEVVWGTYHKEGILDYLKDFEHPRDFLELKNYHFLDATPMDKFAFKSYVPVTHGCDNFCSYCVVPYVRGREISRKSAEIIDNMKRLIDRGVKEVVLLGQNVNSYHDGSTTFPALLEKIAKTTGIERLGFLTSHPKDLTSELLDVVRDNPNIMKNIHLPLQSGNDRILGLMNRKVNVADYLNKIELIKAIPGIVISTDIIVGFPGETEEEFEDTLEVMKKVGFHEAFTYYYNTRPGTKAAEMKDELTIPMKKKRLARLMETQESITTEKLREEIGSHNLMLVEAVSKKNRKELSGRLHNGLMMFIKGRREWIGTIIPVEVTGESGSGLKGKLLKKG